MKKLNFLLFICSFILLNGCKDDSSENQSEIKLSKNELLFEGKGQATNIQLTITPDTEWSIENAPDWLRIEPLSGTQSAEITLICDPIQDMNGRDTTILVETKNKTIKLKIAQAGLDRKSFPIFNRLPGSPVIDLDYKYGQDGKERIYKITNSKILTNPDIKDKIYLGALINCNLETNTKITSYSEYLLKPITVISTSISSHVNSSTFYPSLAEQEKYAKKVLDKIPSGTELAASSSPIQFYSYRELHLIGLGNIGLKLDEILHNKSYQEEEMSKKNGLIYSFYISAFSLIMNLPEDGSITKEKLKEEDFSGQTLAYINQVSYGRIGLLIIESDDTPEQVRSVVNKISKGETLTQKDNDTLQELEAYHLYYDKSQKLHIEKGNEDVIKAYNDRIVNNTQDLYPISYGLANYFLNGVQHATFSLTLP